MVKGRILDASGKMDAMHIGMAARNDVAMQPPGQPSLIGGVRTAVVDGGVLIAGGPSPVYFSGEFARTRLLPLLGHLDGSSDQATIAKQTGLSEQSLYAALSLLHAKRLLQWGPLDGPDSPTESQEILWHALSARLANSRRFRNVAEALGHSEGNPLRIIGSDAFINREELGQQLNNAGVLLTDDERDLGTESLTVALGTISSEEARRLRARGHSFVHAYVHRGLLTLSPLIRSDLPCHSCFLAALTDVDHEHFDGNDNDFKSISVDIQSRLITSLLAGNLVPVALRTAQIKLIRRAVLIDIADGTERSIEIYSRPGCADCGPSPVPAEPAPLIYEDIVAFPPADLLDPATHITHYKPSNVQLQRPDRSSLENSPATTAEPADDAQIKRLLEALRLTFGFRREDGAVEYQRHAPTGGNLGSPEAHVLVGEGVAGLGSGHYQYDGVNERLVHISEREVPVPDGVIHLLLTAALSRMGEKYGANALRLVHLDAGVTCAHFIAAATAQGLRPRLHARADSEALQRQTRRTRRSDPVTALIAIDSSKQVHETEPRSFQGRMHRTLGAEPSAPASPRPTSEQASNKLPAGAALVDQLLQYSDDVADNGVAVPAWHGFEGLGDGILGRISHRTWDRRPVDYSDIEAVAERIARARRALPGDDGSLGVDFAVVGQNVTREPPSSWIIRNDGSLERIKTLAPDPLQNAVIQPEYAEAPVLVIATMRLAELTNRGGVRSYLDALMAAGSALHAGWLDMRGRGLEGGIFAGILPDKSINRLLDGTPWDHRPVLALAVGHPVRLGRG